MNKQVLFIQGAGKGAYREDEKLVASLRQLLGHEYEVHYPAMQNEDEANYETWKDQIEKNLAALDGIVIVVGAHLALYAQRFPQATIRELNRRGHQLNNDLSEVAEDIKRLQD